jgi:hypothetical protein
VSRSTDRAGTRHSFSADGGVLRGDDGFHYAGKEGLALVHDAADVA